MRIGCICRPHHPLHFRNAALRFGALAAAAALVFAPAFAQGPPGAAAAATVAAAAATSAAPAPKRSTASAAIAAAMGNDAAGRTTMNNAVAAGSTEEAANGATPAGGDPALPAATAPALPLKGVAAQCANLLRMATNLKSEVDKTTKDVLSVSVVRQASQIEETAKKMRQRQR